MKIAFIGAGKMAETLIARLSSQPLIASDVDPNRLRYIGKKYRIRTTESNRKAFDFGEVIVLAVKPQHISEILGAVTGRKLIISIAAGVPLQYLEKKLPGAPVIRAMPNNPCLVGAGITALAKGKKVSRKQYAAARKIFNAVGEVIDVPEKWMDAITGLSGSGPAFVYLAIEALTEGGVAEGLPFPVAEKLARQTVFGAAETAKKTVHSLRELRARVTSPGGTTVEGLAVLERYQWAKALAAAVRAAAGKSRLISRKWTL